MGRGDERRFNFFDGGGIVELFVQFLVLELVFGGFCYLFLKAGYLMGKNADQPKSRTFWQVEKHKPTEEPQEYEDPWTEAQAGVESERISTL